MKIRIQTLGGGVDGFSATRTDKPYLFRFRFIAANLRFDDEKDRAGVHGRWQNDRFAAIRLAFFLKPQATANQSPPPASFLIETVLPSKLENCFQRDL
jgi:hypothetical protein